ncbi:SMR family transporter [Pontiellaceae bacterium B12227]|nr:SMR family transporter [Pontiellaceae bacterium B12227]
MKFGWILLMISMLADVVASVLAKQVDGLQRPFMLLSVLGGYLVAILLFMHCMKVLPMGPAFAIWAGGGMVLVAVSAIVFYHQMPDLPAIIGMSLIVLGAVVLSTMSKMQVH